MPRTLEVMKLEDKAWVEVLITPERFSVRRLAVIDWETIATKAFAPLNPLLIAVNVNVWLTCLLMMTA